MFYQNPRSGVMGKNRLSARKAAAFRILETSRNNYMQINYRGDIEGLVLCSVRHEKQTDDDVGGSRGPF